MQFICVHTIAAAAAIYPAACLRFQIGSSQCFACIACYELRTEQTLLLGMTSGSCRASLKAAPDGKSTHGSGMVPAGRCTPSPEAVHAVQAAILDLFAGHTVAVALSGYLFFGSAVNVSRKVLEVRCSLASNWSAVPPACMRAYVAGTCWVWQGRVSAYSSGLQMCPCTCRVCSQFMRVALERARALWTLPPEQWRDAVLLDVLGIKGPHMSAGWFRGVLIPKS